MKYICLILVFTVAFSNYAFAEQPVNLRNQQLPTVKVEQKLISVQEDPQNQLGLIFVSNKIDEAKKLLESGSLEEAEKILLENKKWIEEITEYHYSLFQIFNKQPGNSSKAKIEQAHALDFGHLRDQIYFLLAKVYIVQNKFKDALPLLVGIVKSQDGSSLATDAYKALIEMKFSDQVK